jgi:hypothetical protein
MLRRERQLLGRRVVRTDISGDPAAAPSVSATLPDAVKLTAFSTCLGHCFAGGQVMAMTRSCNQPSASQVMRLTGYTAMTAWQMNDVNTARRWYEQSKQSPLKLRHAENSRNCEKQLMI